MEPVRLTIACPYCRHDQEIEIAWARTGSVLMHCYRDDDGCGRDYAAYWRVEVTTKGIDGEMRRVPPTIDQ